MENKILFENKDIIAAFKPCGMPSQADKTGDLDMVTYLKEHSGQEISIINRLDRPVSGIMLFAKNSDAAALLSKAMQDGRFSKEYTAVLCGRPDNAEGRLSDYLIKEQKTNTSRVVQKGIKGAKEALLEYTVIDAAKDEEFSFLTLVNIKLITGRHHQIRVQFASRGLPLWGDSKYNPAFKRRRGFDGICLCSSRLSFIEPKTGERVELQVRPEGEAFSKFESILKSNRSL